MVVAVGDDGEAGVEELLPQAANNARMPKTSRQNMATVVGLAVFLFLIIVSLC